MTKVQKFMLYCLGKWYEEANSRIKGKPLQVSVSKVSFIELVQSAEMATKQKRAVYRNLEVLEKKKWVSYDNKELMLTARGKKVFESIKKDVEPYVEAAGKLKAKNPMSYTKKVQTIFR